MPLYEYKCTACHKHTEKIQKFSDPEITVCPHCGGHLERVLSAPAVSFKGGGWYADGYGNAKPKSSGDGSSTSRQRLQTRHRFEIQQRLEVQQGERLRQQHRAPAAAPAPASSLLRQEITTRSDPPVEKLLRVPN